MNLVLSKRQLKLIQYLYQYSNWIKGSELSKLYAVSPRTIRNDIEAIKVALGEDIILSSQSKGYQYNRAIDFNTLEIKAVFQPNERVVYLVKELVMKIEGMHVDDYMEIFYVSESTFLSDVQSIKKKIEENDYDVKLQKSGYQVTLIGTLEEKVAFMSYMFKMMIPFTRMNQYKKYFLTFDVDQFVTETIQYMLEQQEISRNFSIRNLIVILAFVVERTILTREVDIKEVTPKEREDISPTTDIIVEGLRKYQELEIETEYIHLINYYVMTVEKIENFERQLLERPLEEDVSYLAIQKIMSDIENTYMLRVDFESDAYKAFYKHLSVALYRAAHAIKVNNPIKYQLQSDYPYYYDVAIQLSQGINRELGLQLNQDEISFLVSHLITLFQPNHIKAAEPSKKAKIYIIAPEGIAVTQYIGDKVIKLLGDQFFDIVEMPYFSMISDLKSQLTKEDLVFSTIPITLDHGKPELILNPQMTLNDEYHMNLLIKQSIESIKDNRFKEMQDRFFDEEFYFQHQSFKKKEEVIDFIGQTLIEKNCVNQAFIASVYEREELLSTSLQSGVALPHATFVKANKTAVVVCHLKQSIPWGGHKVKLVLLFAISQSDYKYLSEFYALISKFAMNSDAIDSLDIKDTFQAFIAELKKCY